MDPLVLAVSADPLTRSQNRRTHDVPSANPFQTCGWLICAAYFYRFYVRLTHASVLVNSERISCSRGIQSGNNTPGQVAFIGVLFKFTTLKIFVASNTVRPEFQKDKLYA